MKTKVKEIRTKADYSLPCPECGAEYRQENVTKLQRRKVKSVSGVVLVLPTHYLDLRCKNCSLELQATLDASGNPTTPD